MSPRFCEQCGAALTAGVRFCEQCGAGIATASPAPTLPPPLPTALGERVLGHIPLALQERGWFGGDRRRDVEMLVTDRRLLLLSAGFLSADERWLEVQGEWEAQAGGEMDEVPPEQWRALVDAADPADPRWSAYYQTPVDAQLRAHRDNLPFPLESVAGAEILLDDAGEDLLRLHFADGHEQQASIYLMMGRACARLLAAALGPARVQVQSAAPRR